MKRIGIVTFHKAYNCGAMLQAWALSRTLSKMGYEVSFPSCNHVGIGLHTNCKIINPFRCNGAFDFVRQCFRLLMANLLSLGVVQYKHFKYLKFRKSNLAEKNIAVRELGEFYDLLVFGSDQIWNLYRSQSPGLNENALFLGEGIPTSIEKIAYAASIGEEGRTDEEVNRVIRAASSFKALSVREEEATKGLVDKFGRPAKWVLDPSLLLYREDYSHVEKRNRMVKGDYVLAYVMTDNAFVRDMVGKAKKAMGMKVVVLYAYHFGLYGLPSCGRIAFSPDEFLAYIRDAKAVLAMSFHGTAFAIIYNKPFVTFRSGNDKVESRSAALVRRFGCVERFVNGANVDSGWERLLRIKPGNEIGTRLSVLRKDSIEWLKDVLEEK